MKATLLATQTDLSVINGGFENLKLRIECLEMRLTFFLGRTACDGWIPAQSLSYQERLSLMSSRRPCFAIRTYGPTRLAIVQRVPGLQIKGIESAHVAKSRNRQRLQRQRHL